MAYKTKVSTEEKIRVVSEYISGRVSLRYGAEQLGVDVKTISDWVHLYNIGGLEALHPPEHLTEYSPEQKLQAVKDYLAGKGSQRDICKKYQIKNPIQLRAWLKVYNAGGCLTTRNLLKGTDSMPKARNTTQDERIRIVKECISCGKNYGETALKYQVSYQQVRTWALRFEEMGEAGLEDRRGKRKKDQVPRTELETAQIEIEQLKHKLYLAEMERDLLKKLDEIERRDAYRK